MATEERPACHSGKLLRATAAGTAGARDADSTPTTRTSLDLAADLLEKGGQQLHPVRLDL